MNELPTGLKSAFIKKVSQGKSLSKEKYLGQNHLFCVKNVVLNRIRSSGKVTKALHRNQSFFLTLGFLFEPH